MRPDAVRRRPHAGVRDGAGRNPLNLHWTPLAIGCLLYLALAGSVGTWLNYWLLERMSATALLSMALVEPLIAVLLGAALLHERVTPAPPREACSCSAASS